MWVLKVVTTLKATEINWFHVTNVFANINDILNYPDGWKTEIADI